MPYNGKIANGISESYLSVLPRMEGDKEAYCIAGLRVAISRDGFNRIRTGVESRLEDARRTTVSADTCLDYNKNGFADVYLQYFPLRLEHSAEAEILAIGDLIRRGMLAGAQQ
jgi:hypothetical protein